MNELEVRVVQTPGKIECNFDELEEALRVQMTAYEALEVTESNIPERKADVATLRKIRGAVDDERKSVKKAYNEPLDAFEKKVKGLTSIIDKAIDGINGQLNAFEVLRINEKSKHIEEIYESEIGELREFLPLDRIMSPKWTNKSVKDNEIIAAIQERKIQVQNDLNAIKGLHSEIEDELVKTYKVNGNNLGAAIRRDADHREAVRVAEERLRERQEAPEPTPEKKVDSSPTEVLKMAQRAQEAANVTPSLTIKVQGESNIQLLRELLEFNNIDYEEVG